MLGLSSAAMDMAAQTFSSPPHEKFIWFGFTAVLVQHSPQFSKEEGFYATARRQ
jgi:hypothetical protein